MSAPRWEDRAVRWSRTSDAEHPFEATVDGRRWVVRINDFPVEPTKYTLLVDGAEAAHFNDWPQPWFRP